MDIKKKQNIEMCHLTDEFEHNQNYRLLLSLYYQRINGYNKIHKNCLLQIEPYYNIKLSRQQSQILQLNFNKIFLKYVDKLIRENINRNKIIKKCIDNYYLLYHQSIQTQQVENTYNQNNLDKLNAQNIINVQNITNIQNIQLYSELNNLQSTIKSQKQYNNPPKVRPTSQKNSRPKSANLCQIKKSNVRTNSSFNRPMKRFSFNFISESVEIFKNKNNQEKVFFQKKKNSRKYHKFLNYKQTINLFQDFSPSKPDLLSFRASVDEDQRRSLKKKIMMINPVIHLGSSHGYKPKSQCKKNQF